MKKKEKTWQERYSEYEALCSEAAGKQGIERDEAYAKCDKIYRDLMTATDAPKTLNQAPNNELPDTVEGIKELFNQRIIIDELLGTDSLLSRSLKLWREDDFHSASQPTLQGKWNKLCRRLVELTAASNGTDQAQKVLTFVPDYRNVGKIKGLILTAKFCEIAFGICNTKLIRKGKQDRTKFSKEFVYRWTF